MANELITVLQTDGVAVVKDAIHLCVSTSGVKDINSTLTLTAEYSGDFLKVTPGNEFLKYLN
jgi:GTP cyclohydrolase IA